MTDLFTLRRGGGLLHDYVNEVLGQQSPEGSRTSPLKSRTVKRDLAPLRWLRPLNLGLKQQVLHSQQPLEHPRTGHRHLAGETSMLTLKVLVSTPPHHACPIQMAQEPLPASLGALPSSSESPRAVKECFLTSSVCPSAAHHLQSPHRCTPETAFTFSAAHTVSSAKPYTSLKLHQGGAPGTHTYTHSTGHPEWLCSLQIAETQTLLHQQRSFNQGQLDPYPDHQNNTRRYINRCRPSRCPPPGRTPSLACRLHHLLSGSYIPAFVASLSDGGHWRCVAVSASTQTIWTFDPLGQPMPAAITDPLQGLLERMPSSTWSVKHLEVTVQYDVYNCGIWSCWLSNELQCFEAQSAISDLTRWLNMRKQLIPGHARTRGDVLRHMYSQARVHAALEPLVEPNPPDMAMADLMADFAVKAASTHPSPALEPLPGYCPDLARYLADIAAIEIPGDLDSPIPEPPNFDLRTPADNEASRSSPSEPTPPMPEAELYDPPSPPAKTPSAKPTPPMQEADLQGHPSLPAEARSPHTPESDTNSASLHPPASIPPPLPDCQTQNFPTQSDAAPSSFSVLSWNVMGYTTVRTELQALLQMHTPDVIILTETKFIKDARLDARLKHMLTEYETYLSSSPRLAPPSDPENGTRQGCAGVLVAIHKRWQPRNFVKRHLHDRMPALTGHVLDLTLETPHGLPLYICGVYLPHDLRQRRAIYEYLVSHAAHSHIVMAGDWNADPLRNSTTLDHQHSRFVAQAASLSCYSLAPAECTHYPGAQQHAPSHLDAFLVSAACRDSGSTTQTLQSSGASDHTPILLTMPSAAQVLRPPVELPKPKFEPRLRRVQTQTALLDFKDQLQLTTAAATTTLQEQLELARLQPDCALPGLVDSLGTELIQLLLDQAMPLASKLLEWTQPPPEKRYAPRKLAKQRLTCLKKQWAVSACLREYREVKHSLYAVPLPPAELTVIAGRLKRSASSWTDVPLVPEHAPLDAPEGWRDVWAAWARTAQRALDGLQRESLKLEHDTDTKNAEKQCKQFQHLFATEQKKANKGLNTTGPSEPITALQDSAGHLCTTQQELLTLTHAYFAAQATAPAETTDTDALPWERPGADPFTLVAEATSPTAQPYSMGAKISDPHYLQRHGQDPGAWQGPWP